jgi:hypothetical protein
VTLTAEDLTGLNDRIANETQANAVPFNLVQLRQVESSREWQRIKNIMVQEVKAQRVGDRLGTRTAPSTMRKT